jgi:hypothetical protein
MVRRRDARRTPSGPDNAPRKPVGTLRHAGCFLFRDNRRQETTMRIMQQTFQMTDLRKRLVLLTLLSFVALC